MRQLSNEVERTMNLEGTPLFKDIKAQKIVF